MNYITCGKWVNLEAGTRCALPVDAAGKHSGPCRAALPSWADMQAMFDARPVPDDLLAEIDPTGWATGLPHAGE